MAVSIASIPNELLSLFLEAAAYISPSTLTALSSVSKPVRAVYKHHEKRLLSIALASRLYYTSDDDPSSYDLALELAREENPKYDLKRQKRFDPVDDEEPLDIDADTAMIHLLKQAVKTHKKITALARCLETESEAYWVEGPDLDLEFTEAQWIYVTYLFAIYGTGDHLKFKSRTRKFGLKKPAGIVRGTTCSVYNRIHWDLRAMSDRAESEVQEPKQNVGDMYGWFHRLDREMKNRRPGIWREWGRLAGVPWSKWDAGFEKPAPGRPAYKGEVELAFTMLRGTEPAKLKKRLQILKEWNLKMDEEEKRIEIDSRRRWEKVRWDGDGRCNGCGKLRSEHTEEQLRFE